MFIAVYSTFIEPPHKMHFHTNIYLLIVFFLKMKMLGVWAVHLRYVKLCSDASYCSKSCLIWWLPRRNISQGMPWIPEQDGVNTRTWSTQMEVHTGAQVGIQCQGRFWTVPNKQLLFQHYKDSEATANPRSHYFSLCFRMGHYVNRRLSQPRQIKNIFQKG